MNTSVQPAGRGSRRKRLGVTSLVLTVAVLISACVPGGGSPPPKDGGDDRKGAPPAHFVLSITPVNIPRPTTTGPGPSTTHPKTTVPKTTIPDETIPNHTIPRTTTPDETIPYHTTPHPTIWDPPPTDTVPSPTFTIPHPTIPQPAPPPNRVVLACNPDAGTHPDPGAACTSLRNVNGHFKKLPADPAGICPDIYAPVRIEAIGYWGTRRVKYTETFSNDCIAAAETDYVFRF